jgi:hypothetical protein
MYVILWGQHVTLRQMHREIVVSFTRALIAGVIVSRLGRSVPQFAFYKYTNYRHHPNVIQGVPNSPRDLGCRLKSDTIISPRSTSR